jgi:hypothetical protein
MRAGMPRPQCHKKVEGISGQGAYCLIVAGSGIAGVDMATHLAGRTRLHHTLLYGWPGGVMGWPEERLPLSHIVTSRCGLVRVEPPRGFGGGKFGRTVPHARTPPPSVNAARRSEPNPVRTVTLQISKADRYCGSISGAGGCFPPPGSLWRPMAALLGSSTESLGHELRPIPPQCVNPYVKPGQNDRTVAEM